MDKVLKMWNNYYQAGQTQFSSAKQISVLIEQDCRWSKQIKLNKEKLQSKSAIHWTCDDEEWN